MSKMDKINKREFLFKRLVLIVCLVSIFTMSLWSIDISVSSALTGNFLQNVVFEYAEPRVVYHLGLVTAMGIMLIFVAMLFYELLKRFD